MAIFNSKLFVYQRVQSMMFLVSRRVYEFSLLNRFYARDLANPLIAG